MAKSRALKTYAKKSWEPELRARTAKISRTGDFINDQNLKIRWYSWDVPEPQAIVVFAHGLGVYGSFEMLTARPLGGVREHYAGSWPERFNAANVSLFCIDHQGHGRSDSSRPGARCYFERADDLARDFTQFVELIKRDSKRPVPVFMMGSSLGGLVVVKAAIATPSVASGVVALAPCISLDRISKGTMNRVLLPILGFVSAWFPTFPLAKTVANARFPLTQAEVERDALTWPSGKKRTRARVAKELLESTFEFKKPGVLERITMPLIAFHGKDDQMTDPSGSQMLADRASSSSSEVRWVDDVFHDLCHEKPGCDVLCDEIIEWCRERINDKLASSSSSSSLSSSSSNKRAKTTAVAKREARPPAPRRASKPSKPSKTAPIDAPTRRTRRGL